VALSRYAKDIIGASLQLTTSVSLASYLCTQ